MHSDTIRKCKSRKELEKVLREYKNLPLKAPLDFNTQISPKQYQHLMKLCSTVTGLNYTFITLEELLEMWGCKKSYAYQLIRNFILWGLIEVIWKSKYGYLIRINPFYVWKSASDFDREMELRKFTEYYLKHIE